MAHGPNMVKSTQGISWRHRILLALVIFLAVAGAVLLVHYLRYYAIDFRLNLWEPASLLVRGESPYNVTVLPTDQSHIAVWFPPVVGLFFPLGWLDLHTAANLWFLLNLGVLFLLLRWYRAERSGGAGTATLETRPPLPGGRQDRPYQGDRSALLPLVLLTLLFPPLFFELSFGQFDLLAVLLLLVSARLLAQGRYFLAGLPLALAVGKPQLGLLALPGLALAAYRRGGWRGLGQLVGAAAGLAALLTLPLWIGYPGWIPDFLGQLLNAPAWFHSSLYTMVELWWGAGWKVVPGLISVVLAGLALFWWWRYPPEEALPWSLALTTVVSPYIWTWNFVLFLPLLARSLYRLRRPAVRWAWVAAVALSWGPMLWLRQTQDYGFHWHFWLPWYYLAVIVGTHVLERWGKARWWRPGPHT